jgi:hypothetical protein
MSMRISSTTTTMTTMTTHSDALRRSKRRHKHRHRHTLDRNHDRARHDTATRAASTGAALTARICSCGMVRMGRGDVVVVRVKRAAADKFALIVFHVCTMMPNVRGDATCNNKRRHIGNDYVCLAVRPAVFTIVCVSAQVNIVFSANSEKFDCSQMVGQHNLVTIVVYPKRLGALRID